MQTFLPYPRFDASAAVLDDLRLGKQRVETLQILRALVWPTYRGWKNHPATAMWRGFTDAPVCYGIAICAEWERRGRADAVRRSLEEFSGTPTADEDDLAQRGRLPPWLGIPAFHEGHRASLVAKLPEHYRLHFPRVDPSLPYEWPTPLFRRWPVRRREPLTRPAARQDRARRAASAPAPAPPRAAPPRVGGGPRRGARRGGPRPAPPPPPPGRWPAGRRPPPRAPRAGSPRLGRLPRPARHLRLP